MEKINEMKPNNRSISKIKFVNLHGHTTYSIFDGFGRPEEHIDFCYMNGCDAMAFTEHGNMNSFPHVFFHSKKMKERWEVF